MSMAFQIEIRPILDFSSSELSRIDAIDHLAFASSPSAPQSNEEPICWSKSEYYGIGILDSQIVSQLAILHREVRVGDQLVRVGGIGGVATHPDFQRRGYANLLLKEAVDFMGHEMKVPFGLLVCSSEREKYYSKSGWLAISSPMIFNYGNGKRTWHETTMILPLSDSLWPAGTVDLNGFPW